MRLQVLGVAGGGGFPQWNCACDLCAKCRRREGPAPSGHAALAVQGEDGSWCLVNATPDVHAHIEATRDLWPTRTFGGARRARTTPVTSVLLTDAELEHTTGLLDLHHGAALDVWATPTVLELLAEDFPVARVLERYAELTWRELTPGKPAPLLEGVEVTPVTVGDRTPRYAREPARPDAVVALRVENPATGGSALWAPQVPAWTDEVREAVASVDVAFVDGTFWHADELARAGAGTLTAAELGHLPVGEQGGLAQQFARTGTPDTADAKGRPTRYLVHVNNTNPIHDPRSPQRAQLGVRGIEVASSGTSLDL